MSRNLSLTPQQLPSAPSPSDSHAELVHCPRPQGQGTAGIGQAQPSPGAAPLGLSLPPVQPDRRSQPDDWTWPVLPGVTGPAQD